MKNVNEMPSRFILTANTLKLGLRFPEGHSQRLHLVSVLCVQSTRPW